MRTFLRLALLCSPALALAQGAAPAAPPAAPPAAEAGPTAQATIQALDELTARREDPAAQKELDAKVDEAVKAFPKDNAVLWRVARNICWHADGAEGDTKKNLGKACWAMADRAKAADPKEPHGPYYGAVGIGAYSQAVGVLTALGEGLEGKFNERIDAAVKMDPSLEHGGPLTVKGRYFFELPWPKRDLGKAASTLQQSIDKHPESLRNYVYLAEVQLKDGKAKDAKATLDKALNGSVAYDKAEGLRAQKMAKKVLPEIEKELK